MIMKHYFEEIRQNTAGMKRIDKAEYILTYYWYHILGVILNTYDPFSYYTFRIPRRSSSFYLCIGESGNQF